MRIMLSGGGTGGHIYPALSIAEEWRQQDKSVEILYVGMKGGPEEELARRAGLSFAGVQVSPLPRRISPRLCQSLYKNSRGLGQARQLIKQFVPDLLLGTGGYVCGVVMLAGSLSHIPTMLHEQNAVAGLTNRWLSRFVDMVCLTYPQAKASLPSSAKTVLTGLPVRSDFLRVAHDEGLEQLGLDPEQRMLLISGGSQGALHINRAMYNLWEDVLAAGWQILHLTGEKNFTEASQEIRRRGLGTEAHLVLKPYLHGMYKAINGADLIISRAGASFLAEVTAVGRPGILIPYPFAAGNHQEANARALVDCGAAILIADHDLEGNSMRDVLLPLLADKERLKQMSAASAALGRPEAAREIVHYGRALIAGKNK